VFLLFPVAVHFENLVVFFAIRHYPRVPIPEFCGFVLGEFFFSDVFRNNLPSLRFGSPWRIPLSRVFCRTPLALSAFCCVTTCCFSLTFLTPPRVVVTSQYTPCRVDCCFFGSTSQSLVFDLYSQTVFSEIFKAPMFPFFNGPTFRESNWNTKSATVFIPRFFPPFPPCHERLLVFQRPLPFCVRRTVSMSKGRFFQKSPQAFRAPMRPPPPVVFQYFS